MIMLHACVPDLLCDADDVQLLEEMGREVTGRLTKEQSPNLAATTATIPNDCITVRLDQFQGVLHNRLASVIQHVSLDNVRVVVAILKDSEIVTTTSPSLPLSWQTLPHNRDAASFCARWDNANDKDAVSDKERGALLSLDHDPRDSASLELLVALVHANETQDESFLLACPCGDATLPLGVGARNSNNKTKMTMLGKHKKRELPVLGRPSPRHYVLFPLIASCHDGATTKSTLQAEKRKRRPEKIEPSLSSSNNHQNNNDEMELPYLSLENATISLEISWKAKELDVEVCYDSTTTNSDGATGRQNHDNYNPQQSLVLDDMVHRHRDPFSFRRDAYSSSSLVETSPGEGERDDDDDIVDRCGHQDDDDNDDDDESQIHVKVVSGVKALAKNRQQRTLNNGVLSNNNNKSGTVSDVKPKILGPAKTEMSTGRNTKGKASSSDDSKHDNQSVSSSVVLKHVMLMRNNSNEGDNECKHDNVSMTAVTSVVIDSKEAPLDSRTDSESSNSSSTQSETDETNNPIKGKDLSPNRFWNKSKRNQSKDSIKTDSTHNNSLVTLDDRNPGEKSAKKRGGFWPRTFRRPGHPDKSQSPQRKKEEGEPIDKSQSPKRKTGEEESTTRKEDLNSKIEYHDSDPNDALADLDMSEAEEASILSEPKVHAKQLQTAQQQLLKSNDDDTIGGIHMLTSFCANALDPTPDSIPAAASIPGEEKVNHEKSAMKADQNQTSCLTWMSYDALEQGNSKDPSFAERMVKGAFLYPQTMCTTVSDVTMDKSLANTNTLERLRSLEDTIVTNSSVGVMSNDEVTTVTNFTEDRFLQKLYNAFGGKQLDRVTDAILQNSPGMLQQWLDSGVAFVDNSGESVYSSSAYSRESSDVSKVTRASFERATTINSTVSQGVLSRQLTTITEETESRALHAPSNSSGEEPASIVHDDVVIVPSDGGCFAKQDSGVEVVSTASVDLERQLLQSVASF